MLCNNLVSCSRGYPEINEKNYLIQYFSVSNNNHTIFGSCNGYIKSSWILQKSNAWPFIRSDTRYDDVIFLSSLISIYWSYLKFFIIIGILGADLTVLLQKAYYISSLTLVRSNDTDLFGSYTSSFKIKENLVDLLGLGSV